MDEAQGAEPIDDAEPDAWSSGGSPRAQETPEIEERPSDEGARLPGLGPPSDHSGESRIDSEQSDDSEPEDDLEPSEAHPDEPEPRPDDPEPYPDEAEPHSDDPELCPDSPQRRPDAEARPDADAESAEARPEEAPSAEALSAEALWAEVSSTEQDDEALRGRLAQKLQLMTQDVNKLGEEANRQEASERREKRRTWAGPAGPTLLTSRRRSRHAAAPSAAGRASRGSTGSPCSGSPRLSSVVPSTLPTASARPESGSERSDRSSPGTGSVVLNSVPTPPESARVAAGEGGGRGGGDLLRAGARGAAPARPGLSEAVAPTCRGRWRAGRARAAPIEMAELNDGILRVASPCPPRAVGSYPESVAVGGEGAGWCPGLPSAAAAAALGIPFESSEDDEECCRRALCRFTRPGGRCFVGAAARGASHAPELADGSLRRLLQQSADAVMAARAAADADGAAAAADLPGLLRDLGVELAVLTGRGVARASEHAVLELLVALVELLDALAWPEGGDGPGPESCYGGEVPSITLATQLGARGFLPACLQLLDASAQRPPPGAAEPLELQLHAALAVRLALECGSRGGWATAPPAREAVVAVGGHEQILVAASSLLAELQPQGGARRWRSSAIAAWPPAGRLAGALGQLALLLDSLRLLLSSEGCGVRLLSGAAPAPTCECDGDGGSSSGARASATPLAPLAAEALETLAAAAAAAPQLEEAGRGSEDCLSSAIGAAAAAAVGLLALLAGLPAALVPVDARAVARALRRLLARQRLDTRLASAFRVLAGSCAGGQLRQSTAFLFGYVPRFDRCLCKAMAKESVASELARAAVHAMEGRGGGGAAAAELLQGSTAPLGQRAMQHLERRYDAVRMYQAVEEFARAVDGSSSVVAEELGRLHDGRGPPAGDGDGDESADSRPLRGRASFQRAFASLKRNIREGFVLPGRTTHHRLRAARE